METTSTILKQPPVTLVGWHLIHKIIYTVHVSIWGKNIEIFTFDGHKVQQVTYPQLSTADGILVDGGTYTIIADRGRRQV